MGIYEVYWYPRIPGDCEKQNTYVYANNAKDAMNNKYFKHVDVAYCERVTGQLEEDARKYGWCVNKES